MPAFCKQFGGTTVWFSFSYYQQWNGHMIPVSFQQFYSNALTFNSTFCIDRWTKHNALHHTQEKHIRML